jgi:hypothetical protein
MHFNHLGLPVRDARRSQQFYTAYFGFDPATARQYPDGTVIIRNADGFDLALHPVEHIESLPAFLHAGFKAQRPPTWARCWTAWKLTASPSWNGMMNRPTRRSSASTQTATGSKCTGSRLSQGNADSPAAFRKAPETRHLCWHGCVGGLLPMAHRA